MQNSKKESLSTTSGKTASLALVGVMTAVACILGPIAVPLPFSPVPISLTHLSVFLAVYALGMQKGTLSYLVYLLLGSVGLPVFSGYQGGLAKLAGPTGGYLIGFIFMAVVAGIVIDRTANRFWHFLAMLAGDALCYLFGTVWIIHQLHMSIPAAMTACILPYLPGDLLKMGICLLIGPVIRTQLRRAGLFKG